MTLVPAYGRDYKSKKAVLEDFDAGKDFEAVGYDGNGYVNKEQLAGKTVTIRYKRLTQAMIVRVPAAVAESPAID